MLAVAKKTIGFYSFGVANVRSLVLLMSKSTQKANPSMGHCFSYPLDVTDGKHGTNGSGTLPRMSPSKMVMF